MTAMRMNNVTLPERNIRFVADPIERQFARSGG